MKVHDMGRSNIIPVKNKFKTTLEMEPQDEPRNTKIHPLSELKVLVKIGRFFGKLKNYELGNLPNKIFPYFFNVKSIFF